MSMLVIPLLSPTNRTVEGPRLQHDRDRLIVQYDCQSDGGATTWSSVVFLEVLDLEYRQMPCCTEDSILEAQGMRSQGKSPRLTEVIRLWEESVGWQEWQQHQGGASRFRHFTIFFDDVGCIDVVAASCEVPGT